jgi:hypothetical protein
MRALVLRGLLFLIWALPCIGTEAGHAQGVTTAVLRGTVRAADGGAVDGARIVVVNVATGYAVRTEVRSERFLVHGLEVGGPYLLRVEQVGYRPLERDGLQLALGEPLQLHLELQPFALLLDTLHAAITVFPRVNDHGGTGILITDSVLHRLPSLDRNLYDFVRLAPQVSTRIGFAPGGMSAGGVGFRYNNYLINGVTQRSIGGQVPPEFAGSRSLPFEAVSSYQILVAPFDVRYGDFAGALVNAVTRAGTNELRGSAFLHARSDELGRQETQTRYERLQYGFSLGGPLRRDRAHFFTAAEFQHLAFPAAGPWVGQPETAPQPVPVLAEDLLRLRDVLRGWGLEAGSGGPVENRNPLGSLFGRVDIALPELNSRAVAWITETRSSNMNFTRVGSDEFRLTSNTSRQASTVRNGSLQVHTNVGNAHNALLLSHRYAGGRSRADIFQPVVIVGVPGARGGTVAVTTGTPPVAQGAFLNGWAAGLRDDLTLPLGTRHLAIMGVEVERFQAGRGGPLNAWGQWMFGSMDSLAAGLAARYEVARDFGSGSATLQGGWYAAWLGDQWQVSDRLSLTFGLRADMLTLDRRPPRNARIEEIFERRTDAVPAPHLHLSPRVGFTWDPQGRGHDQLRGGVGVFTVRPPLAWLHAPLYSYGVGVGVLRCGATPGDHGPPPSFTPTRHDPPTACANGASVAADPRGAVELVDTRLRMGRTARGVLAWDRKLPGRMQATVEAVATRGVSDFVFVNLNLEGPQGVDAHGRVLYGSIGPTGMAVPARRSDFAQVISLQNTSANYGWQLSTRLERHFAAGASGMAHYTYSRVRDVQTPLRVYAGASENWASRAVSGSHDDLDPGISLNDVPHRVVIAATGRAPWQRWTTSFAASWVSEAGSPFTYRTRGAVRRGDLNADGSNTNDPIYVPRSAVDQAEIRFAPLVRRDTGDTIPAAVQAADFDRFIESRYCLARQRGRILERNSCREPWANTTVASVRQAVPVGGRVIEAQADLFNVLNLLRREWGKFRLADPALLEHVGQVADGAGVTHPVFHFDAERADWITDPALSSFQLQLGIRYRF